MLSNDETKIIQESYAQLYSYGPEFSQKFYKNLFELAPETRGLFSTDIDTQGRKFMEVLSMIILDLQDENLIIPLLKDMGKRHIAYGAEPHHYNVVGKALILTLDHAFKGLWTKTEKSLWIKLYTHIAELMMSADEES